MHLDVRCVCACIVCLYSICLSSIFRSPPAPFGSNESDCCFLYEPEYRTKLIFLPAFLTLVFGIEMHFDFDDAGAPSSPERYQMSKKKINSHVPKCGVLPSCVCSCVCVHRIEEASFESHVRIKIIMLHYMHRSQAEWMKESSSIDVRFWIGNERTQHQQTATRKLTTQPHNIHIHTHSDMSSDYLSK